MENTRIKSIIFLLCLLFSCVLAVVIRGAMLGESPLVEQGDSHNHSQNTIVAEAAEISTYAADSHTYIYFTSPYYPLDITTYYNEYGADGWYQYYSVPDSSTPISVCYYSGSYSEYIDSVAFASGKRCSLSVSLPIEATSASSMRVSVSAELTLVFQSDRYPLYADCNFRTDDTSTDHDSSPRIEISASSNSITLYATSSDELKLVNLVNRAGYTVHYCSIDLSKGYNATASGRTVYVSVQAYCNSHTYNISAPTCTISRHCTTCGYIDQPALKHNYDGQEWQTIISPTCTTSGSRRRYCARCGVSDTEGITALGHDPTVQVVAPSIYENGYTRHGCTRCSYSYTNDYVEKITSARTTLVFLSDHYPLTLSFDFKTDDNSADAVESDRTIYEWNNYIELYYYNRDELSLYRIRNDFGYYPYYCSIDLSKGYKAIRNETIYITIYAFCPEGNHIPNIPAATCTENKFCTHCGYIIQYALGHDRVETTDDHGSYYTCNRCHLEEVSVTVVKKDGTFEVYYITRGNTVSSNHLPSDYRTVIDREGNEEYFYGWASTATTEYCTYQEATKLKLMYNTTFTATFQTFTTAASIFRRILSDEFIPLYITMGSLAGLWGVWIAVKYMRARGTEDKVKTQVMIINLFVGLVIIAAIVVITPILVGGFEIMFASF